MNPVFYLSLCQFQHEAQEASDLCGSSPYDSRAPRDPESGWLHRLHTRVLHTSHPTYPLSGPLRGSRLSPLHMAKHPSMTLATTGSVLAHKPWAFSGPDNVSLTLTDSKGLASSNQDPLVWLFAHVQTDPEDVCMIWWRQKWWELTASGICCNNHKSCNELFLFSAY